MSAPVRDDWLAAESGTERRLGGFLGTVDLAAADLCAHAGAFERLREGTLQAIVLHGVYSPALMQRTVDRLERHAPPFLKTWFPPAFNAFFYGRNINLADAALDGYFAEAARFAGQLDELMPAGLGLADRVCGLLSQLDRGRPVQAAPGPDPGQRYMFTTLRAHAPQGYIPAHFDNEMRLRPSYRHLAGIVEPHILSFVLTLAPGDRGGALEVFDLRCEPGDAQLLSDDRVRGAKPDLDRLSSVRFRLPAGSLIVLDSGRTLHRVTPVGGAATRWTACSFMALSRTTPAMMCWG